jgi:uncharacterized protein YjiS (DUF1127 family)
MRTLTRMESSVTSSPIAALGLTAIRNEVHRVSRFLYLCYQRSVQRRVLGELDDRLLSDIGVDRAEAWREANRLPWEA